MAATGKAKDFLHKKKREFTHKRGRIGRSLFFANLCLVLGLSAIYIIFVFLVVNGLDEVGVPRIIYNNVYYLSTGAMYIMVALSTRGLRYKRLRDMGLPVLADLPFMLLLLCTGLGPFFYFFDVPYLRNLNVVHMPGNLRDLLGVLWTIWLLVLILAPSKRRANIFCTLPVERLK